MLSDPGQVNMHLAVSQIFSFILWVNKMNGMTVTVLYLTVAVLLSTFQLSRCNLKRVMPTSLPSIFRQAHQTSDQLLVRETDSL